MSNGDQKIQPQPNEKAPIREPGQLSPPIVRGPIHECARAVHVEGFVPHALVVVYANTTEIVGQRRPYFGYDDIPLVRALVVGDRITATQEAFGLTSVQSYVPVVVDHQPGSLGKPTIGPVVYACGQIVPVGGLTPSTHIEVYAAPTTPVPIIATNLIGQGECTGAWLPVVTQPLKEGWFVAARQVSCPGTNHEIASPPSDSLRVPAEPSPVRPPVLDPPVVGNDVADLEALYVGAAVEVTDVTASAVVGGGLATADRNWTRVQPPIQNGHRYHAGQKLCTASPPGRDVNPTTEVAAPVLTSPICPGDRSVTVLGTVINATVVLYRVGTALPIGIGGAAPGEAHLSIGPAFLPLNIGDVLYVRQYFGTVVISQPSNNVTIVDCGNVITQHNDKSRSGAYLHETTLTPATVAGPLFGRIFEREVDGSPYAQILYVRNVTGTHLGTKNVFIVATSTNTVYAFDADDHTVGPNAGLVWRRTLGPTRMLNADEI